MEVGTLLTCINFAAIKHKDQRRKDKENTPYINHPIGVANLLWEGGIRDMMVLQAAVLHDTLEDTDTKYDELDKEFGKEVAQIVLECTDDKSLPKDQRKIHQVSHTGHISKNAQLVKLADKLYNLRDLIRSPPPGWNSERIQGYFVWAKEVINQIPKGTNEYLQKELDKVFESQFVVDGTTHPTIPNNKPGALEEYYASLRKGNEK